MKSFKSLSKTELYIRKRVIDLPKYQASLIGNYYNSQKIIAHATMVQFVPFLLTLENIEYHFRNLTRWITKMIANWNGKRKILEKNWFPRMKKKMRKKRTRMNKT